MLHMGYLIVLDGQSINKSRFGNSIAFGKSTSQRIYPEQHTPKTGWKLHGYGPKHALHSWDIHFVW